MTSRKIEKKKPAKYKDKNNMKICKQYSRKIFRPLQGCHFFPSQDSLTFQTYFLKLPETKITHILPSTHTKKKKKKKKLKFLG